MSKRKSFGNPLTKALGKALDKVAPEIVDGVMDVATGPNKGTKNESSSSSADPTDWATRVPGTPRKRHR
jgi:hypothetical protein